MQARIVLPEVHAAQEFAKTAAPLHAQTTPNSDFPWSKTMSSAFGSPKVALTSQPILTYPDFFKPYVVETHDYLIAVRAILTQRILKGGETPFNTLVL